MNALYVLNARDTGYCSEQHASMVCFYASHLGPGWCPFVIRLYTLPILVPGHARQGLF